MDKVKLQTVVNRKYEIMKFRQPSWDKKGAERFNIQDIN